MTLRRKMVNQIIVMVVAVLLIGGASLWGLTGLTAEFDAAIRGYEELRQVFDVEAHVRTGQRLLELSHMGAASAAVELSRAAEKVESTLGRYAAGRPEGDRKTVLRRTIHSSLVEATRLLRVPPEGRQADDLRNADVLMTRTVIHAGQLVAEIQQEIEEKRLDADQRQRATTLTVAGISILVMLSVIAFGILQYRSVMRPLRQLARGVRTVAHGNFEGRVSTDSYAEFAALADDFNRMADELQAVYRDLEQKVATKSRELVRSERLASVGYLAAGVAHEINNPIGIMAGYAEFSLKQLEASREPEHVEEAEKSLRVICEEAFRCKQIVSKLLALARPGDENRKPVSLGDVARNVASIVEGLGEFKNRKLSVQAEPSEKLRVIASEGEMKQIVLNLTLNALEATSGKPNGEVRVDVARRDGWVELSVQDNGKGMSAETVERVFEPFFTEKRGATQPGTGLGLSITHAIVESHGGKISAQSEGVGKGSRFVVQLPPAT